MSWEIDDRDSCGDYCGHDAHCPHCGSGYFFEVGFGPLKCDICGYSYQEPSVPINTKDDDVLLDDRYVTFDPVAAFRILRDLGLLDKCT